jgi:hypothetical protein
MFQGRSDQLSIGSGSMCPARLQFLAPLCQRRAISTSAIVARLANGSDESGQHHELDPQSPVDERITNELVRARSAVARNCLVTPTAVSARWHEPATRTRCRSTHAAPNPRQTCRFPATGLSFHGVAGYYTSHSFGITCAPRQSRCRVRHCRRTAHACRDYRTPRRRAGRAETSPCRDPARCRHA